MSRGYEFIRELISKMLQVTYRIIKSRAQNNNKVVGQRPAPPTPRLKRKFKLTIIEFAFCLEADLQADKQYRYWTT